MSSHDPVQDLPPASTGARVGALLVVRITPADVGKRVTVRHRYDATTLTDVVGHLLEWTEAPSSVLRVQRRDGTVTEVLLDDVVAAKVVPPPPPPRTRRSA